MVSAREDRDLHLQECAEFWSNGGEEEISKYVKALRQLEQEAGMFRHFQVIRGKGKRGGLQSISVPINPEADEQEWVFRKIYDQRLMAEEIIKRNQKHFGQAQGSPPMDPKIKKLLGKYGENGLQGLQNCLQAD